MLCVVQLIRIQLFQLRLSSSKAEKSNTSAKGLLESLKYSIKNSSFLKQFKLSRSYSTFLLCSGTTLIEIAVCTAQNMKMAMDVFVGHPFRNCLSEEYVAKIKT